MALVKVTDAIRDGTICKGDMIDFTACFREDKNVATFTIEDVVHMFGREPLLWVCMEDYSGNLVALSSTTEFNLPFRGKDAFDHANEVLNTMHSTYSNEEIGLYVRGLSENDAKHWEKNYFFKNRRRTWVMDRGFIVFSGSSTYHKGKCIDSNNDVLTIHHFACSDDDHGKGGIANIISLEKLATEVLVDTESKARFGAWKLIPASPEN